MTRAPVSNSEISTFKECKRKWWLSHYRRLQKAHDDIGGPLRTGTLIHKVIETYYTEDEAAAMLCLTTLWIDDLQRYGCGPDDPAPPSMVEAHDMARAVCEGYFQWLQETGADQDFEVVGAEIKLQAPSSVPGVDLIGKIDLLVHKLSTSELLALDHKSCQELATPVKWLRLNQQFTHYHLLQKLVHPDQPVSGTVWNGLRKVKRTKAAKPPFFARYEVYHTEEDLASYWQQLHGVITDMMRLEAQLDAGTDPMVVAYPSPTRDCSWKCPFFLICPGFDDKRTDTEGYLADNFVVGDPLARYDEDGVPVT